MASSPLIPVGLVGFGTGSSVFHAPLLMSSGKFALTHVLERSTSKSSVLQPAPQIVRSMDELVAAPVELIVISTPTHVHFEQAKQAILAKKHVVVDKPLTIAAKDAQELVDLAKENGVLFAVFQNRRWDSDFLTVRSLIDSGAFGDLVKYEAHYDRYRPSLKGYWKEQAELGGGVLYDLGAHLVDQALQLFGEPDAVDADVQVQREGGENDDYFRLEFKYSKFPQLQVILTAGMMVKDLGPKYIIEGSKGKFEKYGEDIQEPQLREGLRPGDAGFGDEPESQFGKFVGADGVAQVIPSKTGTYDVYYNNIAAAIRTGEKLLVNPVEVVPQIRILEEAKKTERVNRQ
ncbi:Oxidoreductase, partial [Globisporangium splendens]